MSTDLEKNEMIAVKRFTTKPSDSKVSTYILERVYGIYGIYIDIGEGIYIDSGMGLSNRSLHR